MRILPYGDRALLAELDSLEHAMLLTAALERHRADAPGVVELVPGARTVLVRIDPQILSLTATERWIAAAESSLGSAVPTQTTARVTLPVRYDGPDLADTARLLGLTVEELIERHSGARWRAAFVGFAPGFAYLASSDFGFDVPRRPTSRPRVATGSVGLAGEFSGVYPRESPGGWQLLGRTDTVLWDTGRTPPALLQPGTEVTFEVVRP